MREHTNPHDAAARFMSCGIDSGSLERTNDSNALGSQLEPPAAATDRLQLVTLGLSGGISIVLPIPSCAQKRSTASSPVFLRYRLRQGFAPARLRIEKTRPLTPVMCGEIGLALDSAALHELCDWSPAEACETHLPPELCQLVNDMLSERFEGAVARSWLLAKSIELLCLTAREALGGKLVATVIDHPRLSMTDCEKISVVRQLIHDRWAEGWTLDKFARLVGINRSKLTLGFRICSGQSISYALRARRLEQARLDLISTETAIARIGWRHGYQSSASFTRAFCRQYGVTPAQVRSNPSRSRLP